MTTARARRFMVRNLKALADADGARRRRARLFLLDLDDNYEWNHGMNIRMGLYAVDKDDPTKRRVARSGRRLRTIARWHVLPDALVLEIT